MAPSPGPSQAWSVSCDCWCVRRSRQADSESGPPGDTQAGVQVDSDCGRAAAAAVTQAGMVTDEFLA